MNHWRWWVSVPLLICFGRITIAAADLAPRTSLAYDAYLKQAEEAFLSRIRSGASAATSRDGVRPARPGRENGIITVPGGLIHHWVGSAFIPHTTLRRAVDVSTSYSAYARIYKEVIASTLIEQSGDTYRIVIRLKEGEAGVSAVLDIHSTVRYFHPTDRAVYAISNADEIREVQNAGQSNEQLLPAGRDSGYLWRTSSFTAFRESDAGVSVEMETLGLSRGFPPLLGWFIEPIARRLGRRSIERSLQEFAAAVRNAAAPASTWRPATCGDRAVRHTRLWKNDGGGTAGRAHPSIRARL